MPMAHAALGNHVVGKMLYLYHITFQHRNLQAVVMTDMHMQRGDGEIVMMMLVPPAGSPVRVSHVHTRTTERHTRAVIPATEDPG